MPDKTAPIDIFEYVDFRLFLDQYYRARKAVDAKFSHRYISTHIRTGSAGWFSDIVKGRTNLSSTHLVALVKVLGLNAAETEYFDCLVRFGQASSVEEKNLHYRKMVGLKGVKPEMIGKDRFEYYSHWYHSVIRELLFFHDFKGDFAALAKKLHPPIGASEARKSVGVLESLGFIKRQAGGSYKPTSATLKKDPAFKAIHFANFMKANIALGMDSLEIFPKEERDVSTMTISLSPEGFKKAKEEIRALREKLLALTELDDQPDRVYQFNLHAFPVTK